MQTLTLPASLESLSSLRRFVEEVSAGIGRDDQTIYDFKLAVDEIATNAITYGEVLERRTVISAGCVFGCGKVAEVDAMFVDGNAGHPC